MNNAVTGVPIWEKFTLTIGGASQYFNIGEKKLRRLAEDYPDNGFTLQNGSKTLIKRKSFEDFLNEASSI